MKFNDTAPVMTPTAGVPLWLARLAENATLEATVLKRPIDGRADILSVIKHAVSLYEFQQHAYKGMIGNRLYLESYRSRVNGVPIETVVVAHMNEQGETDSVVINHRPLDAALLFSQLMRERVDERFRACYLSEPEAAALNTAADVYRAISHRTRSTIMTQSVSKTPLSPAVDAGSSTCSTVPTSSSPGPAVNVGEVQVNADISLRHMVYRPADPKGTVLFLHGFPETMYAWKPIAESLSSDYEVHAFDWPGYGQSSRPPADTFSYAPKDYARVLADYIHASGIDSSKLVIYATDIGALPALLAALEQPDIAREIIVGDFAPFNRPQYMYESLQGLKSTPSSDIVHAAMNKNRDEILANTFFRGMSDEERYALPKEFTDDMAKGWDGDVTAADAFFHYYACFTRDQDYFEANMAALKVPVKVVWGEKDIYIKKEMGIEYANRNGAKISILPELGHFPHLQAPDQTVNEVRAAFGAASDCGTK